MKTNSESELNKEKQLNIAVVISRFLFSVYFIIASLIIGLLLPITPFYYIITGRNWIEKCANVAQIVSDRLFQNGL